MQNCAPGTDLIMLAAAIAVALSSNLSVDEISLLAGLFCAIGDNLSLIAGKKDLCEANKDE